ncbi:MAG: AraC family transcriptional regulator [Gammaproteobacteria bacterium]|jgi:AraC-like DNA-binding protein|nr:AraC family transcriptional regulator [Gammaproteobacteria bacterium]
MDSDFNLLSTLTLLGAAQGVFLALALVNTQSGDIRAHRLLALLTFIFSLDLGEEFLYQTGFFEAVPELLQVLAPIDLLYGPLVYLYVLQLTKPVNHGTVTRNYWHFLPVLIGIVLLLPFFLLDGPQKLALTEALRTGDAMEKGTANVMLIELGVTLFMLGTIVQLGLYLLFSIKRLIRHSSSIKNEFSDIDRINLAWLRNLLLGLGCIYLLYLGDQFFPDLMGMNILGDMVTVMAVILIYSMGYFGLRQPAIFTRASIAQPAAVEAGVDPAEEKYRRSGLDKETSRVFLNELTGHMEANKPYLEGDLVLPQLAQQLGISANYLSQVINEQLHVNFYDFINGYRVEEAKGLIRNAGPKNTNILNIALDSGFNSKSAFYTAFKKATSMTPTQYRKTV